MKNDDREKGRIIRIKGKKNSKIKNLDEKDIENLKQIKIIELEEMNIQDLKILKVKIETAIDNKEKE